VQRFSVFRTSYAGRYFHPGPHHAPRGPRREQDDANAIATGGTWVALQQVWIFRAISLFSFTRALFLPHDALRASIKTKETRGNIMAVRKLIVITGLLLAAAAPLAAQTARPAPLHAWAPQP
jgi:hypothetical protein